MNAHVLWLPGALWQDVRHRLATRLKPHARRLRTALAVALSLLLHVLFVLFLIPSQPSDFSGGGNGETTSGAGEGVAVTLYRLDKLPIQALQVKAQAPEDSEAISDLSLTTDAAITPADLSTALPQMTLPEIAQAASEGGEGQGGTTSGAGDELWAAIAPCWNRMADADATPVTLQITFSADGHFESAAHIIRAPGTVLSDPVLRASTKAIQALAACGSYPMAGGRKDVVINFPKP